LLTSSLFRCDLSPNGSRPPARLAISSWALWHLFGAVCAATARLIAAVPDPRNGIQLFLGRRLRHASHASARRRSLFCRSGFLRRTQPVCAWLEPPSAPAYVTRLCHGACAFATMAEAASPAAPPARSGLPRCRGVLAALTYRGAVLRMCTTLLWKLVFHPSATDYTVTFGKACA